jgi:hypothetical protein
MNVSKQGCCAQNAIKRNFAVAAKHYVHPYCEEGEKCMCGEPATHKVKEDISHGMNHFPAGMN